MLLSPLWLAVAFLHAAAGCDKISTSVSWGPWARKKLKVGRALKEGRRDQDSHVEEEEAVG